MWKFETLHQVEEASKNARKLFLTLLLGCVYSWLTIATTTDPLLLTNSASSTLPIVGATVPMIYFYWAAPALLLGIYIYFHLCMQRLWEGLAKLPAIFPDGRPLDERIYPWLLSGLVRAHSVRLRRVPPVYFGLQAGVSVALAWWFFPLTIFFFWGRYLKRHDLWGTGLHILLIGIVIFFGITFYHRAVETIRNEKWRIPPWKLIVSSILASVWAMLPSQVNYWFMHERQVDQIEWSELVVYFSEMIFIAVIAMVAFYFASSAASEVRLQPWTRKNISKMVPGIFLFMSCFSLYSFGAMHGFGKTAPWGRADFYEADVSTKPANWTGKEIDLIKGAKLKNAKLQYCLANGAFLVRADLRRADLTNANLSEADLRDADLLGADLSRADLSNAKLFRANLTNADLSWAKLSHADLSNANLKDADLRNAKLLRADLSNANLKDADLTDANPWEADLSNANLSNADLTNANLLEADLSNANLRDADLTNANLWRADLSNADLNNANLSNANLLWADLTNADLRDADLRYTIDLTEEQIGSAIIDENTTLPEHLEHLKEELLKAQRERESSLTEGDEQTRE